MPVTQSFTLLCCLLHTSQVQAGTEYTKSQYEASAAAKESFFARKMAVSHSIAYQ